MSAAGQAAGPGEGTGSYPGLLAGLVAAIRPEFRHDVLVFTPGDLVFAGVPCRVEGCGRAAWPGNATMCSGHYTRWVRAGRPEPDQFAAITAGKAWYGYAPLPACRVPGCGFGVQNRRLCSRHLGAWWRAGKPQVDHWLATVPPVTAAPGQVACLVGPCQLRAEPGLTVVLDP